MRRSYQAERPRPYPRLKAEDIRIDVGRAVGGDFMKVTHLPTGIARGKGPPLGSAKAMHEFRRQALREIESEIRRKGMSQYLLPRTPMSNQWGKW